MVICLERGADLHMAQLMLLPLTVSCFSKIQNWFYLSGTGSPGWSRTKGRLVCVCVCVCACACACACSLTEGNLLLSNWACVLMFLMQTKSESSILGNMHGSARYIAFIQKIGDVLRLTDCVPCTVYLGGLDHRGTDGPFVYSWRAEFMQGTCTCSAGSLRLIK